MATRASRRITTVGIERMQMKIYNALWPPFFSFKNERRGLLRSFPSAGGIFYYSSGDVLSRESHLKYFEGGILEEFRCFLMRGMFPAGLIGMLLPRSTWNRLSGIFQDERRPPDKPIPVTVTEHEGAFVSVVAGRFLCFM